MKPSDIYALNMLVAPVLLLFFHWAQPRATWLKITFISAPISWLLINSALKLDPPDNGFVAIVYFFGGWLLLPSVCIVLCLFEWLVFRILGIAKESPRLRLMGQSGCVILGLLMGAFTTYGLFGRIDATVALKNADFILKAHQYVPTQPNPPEWINGYWVIRYPHSTFGEIELDRNGRMSRIGNGP